jgi:hypothetical protein
MKTLVITMGALLALAVPASSSAAGSARWITDPTCTATTTALTCTGQAAGVVQPKDNPYPVVAGIQGEIHYTCSSPIADFETSFFGFPREDHANAYLVDDAYFHNGQTFSVEFLAPPNPRYLTALFSCAIRLGVWIRDPLYYNVRVVVGWGFGGATPVEALEGAVGTVSPG